MDGRLDGRTDRQTDAELRRLSCQQACDLQHGSCLTVPAACQLADGKSYFHKKLKPHVIPSLCQEKILLKTTR